MRALDDPYRLAGVVAGSPGPPTAVADLALAVAAHDLDSRLELPSEPLPTELWDKLLSRAYSQRISGLLVQAIGEGAFAATDAQVAEAADLHHAAMFSAVRLERGLLEIADLLEAASIPYRVLKGPALAHLAYADPTLRPFVDVDVLVPAQHFDAAVATFSGLGHVRKFAEPRAGFDRRFGKAASFSGPLGWELDLHRSLVLGPFGLAIQLEDLFADASEVTLAGRSLPCFTAELRFLHACYHAAVADVPPRLIPVRDVVETLPSGQELDRALATARRWRGEAVVARALLLAWTQLGLTSTPPALEWAHSFRPSRFEARAMRLYGVDPPGYVLHTVVGLSAIDGVGAKLSYLRALLLPSRSYLDTREGAYTRRFARAARAALQLRRR